MALDYLSSNINEVIRAVLNFLLFFTKRFRTHRKAPKSTKSTKKHQKAQKAQKRNQAKAQNANKRTKIKNALTYLLTGINISKPEAFLRLSIGTFWYRLGPYTNKNWFSGTG